MLVFGAVFFPGVYVPVVRYKSSWTATAAVAVVMGANHPTLGRTVQNLNSMSRFTPPPPRFDAITTIIINNVGGCAWSHGQFSTCFHIWRYRGVSMLPIVRDEIKIWSWSIIVGKIADWRLVAPNLQKWNQHLVARLESPSPNCWGPNQHLMVWLGNSVPNL